MQNMRERQPFRNISKIKLFPEATMNMLFYFYSEFLQKIPATDWDADFEGVNLHVTSLTLSLCCGSLTLSRQRLISYRNQSIDLQSKSMDWFLYDIGLRRKRLKYFIPALINAEQLLL